MRLPTASLSWQEESSQFAAFQGPLAGLGWPRLEHTTAGAAAPPPEPRAPPCRICGNSPPQRQEKPIQEDLTALLGKCGCARHALEPEECMRRSQTFSNCHCGCINLFASALLVLSTQDQLPAPNSLPAAAKQGSLITETGNGLG